MRLRMLDYLAIYPLIAGTFTPLCLVFFHNSVVGWCFFGVVWALAIAGMIMTATMFGMIPKWFSMTTYVTLGWLGACMIGWLSKEVSNGAIVLLGLGGIFYTVGGYVYTSEKPNPVPGVFGFHEIWHIAVIFGAASHWFMMYFYVLPWSGEKKEI
mmetsp:Transcript_16807/g.23795  ORF Transcript_16807/g.23795 Transcript_16807/m.23795 type:complete len:155 (+) Transcript_16807:266-730(+)